MKYISLLAVFAACAVSSAQSAGQSLWDVGGAWDFKSNSPVVLGSYSIKRKVLSPQWTISADAFAGASIQAGANGSQGLLGGGGLSFVYNPPKVALSLVGGTGFGVFAGSQPHLIVYGGVRF